MNLVGLVRLRNRLMWLGAASSLLTQLVLSYIELLESNFRSYTEGIDLLTKGTSDVVARSYLPTMVNLNASATTISDAMKWWLMLSKWTLGVAFLSLVAVLVLNLTIRRRRHMEPPPDLSSTMSTLLGQLEAAEASAVSSRQEHAKAVAERERIETLLTLEPDQLRAIEASVGARSPFRRRADSVGLYIGIVAGAAALILLCVQVFNAAH